MPAYDVIVIGSGIGGAMAAGPLVAAGLRVLMVERGDWVPRDPSNWAPDGTIELTPWLRDDGTFRRAGRRGRSIRTAACVGGQAVFFGGAVLRYRPEDFAPPREIIADSGAQWPWGYEELEPHYAAAEHLLDVAGCVGDDPTAPPRSTPFPQPPMALTPVAQRIAEAARAVGLTPSHLPLAINGRAGPRRCRACGTCDSFACGQGSKNDPAATLLPGLVAAGLELRTGVTALRLETCGRTITGLTCHDRLRARCVTLRARAYVLAAGTLATPHLLLSSGLDRLNSAGLAVGRYLLKHCNAVVFGVFPRRLGGIDRFHKQLCFFDHYFGGLPAAPGSRLGVIQQIHPPPAGLLRAMLSAPLGALAAAAVPHMTGLVVIAEDQPRAENRIALDHRAPRDRFGRPAAVVTHAYSSRDRAARAALVGVARRVLRRAGAAWCYVHPIETYTHAVGTVRMGPDPATAPVDARGAFRGVNNLYVADGSVLPTAAGVNPALTIAATALHTGVCLASTLTNGAVHEARVSGMWLGHAPARPDPRRAPDAA